MWEYVLESVLLLNVHGKEGFTPASLRAGAATLMYTRTRDLSRVRWFLRHQSDDTLEHYIQELPAALARGRLSGQSTAVVSVVAPFFARGLTDVPKGIFGAPISSSQPRIIFPRKPIARKLPYSLTI